MYLSALVDRAWGSQYNNVLNPEEVYFLMTHVM